MPSNIHPALAALAVPIDSLVEDPRNARLHNARNIAAIVASLREFGQRKPIVVQAEGRIIRAGNGTLRAAVELGWTEIAALVVDEDEIKARAFAIADNRSGELAEWDFEELSGVLKDLSAGMGPGILADLSFEQVDLSVMHAAAVLEGSDADRFKQETREIATRFEAEHGASGPAGKQAEQCWVWCDLGTVAVRDEVIAALGSRKSSRELDRDLLLQAIRAVRQ